MAQGERTISLLARLDARGAPEEPARPSRPPEKVWRSAGVVLRRPVAQRRADADGTVAHEARTARAQNAADRLPPSAVARQTGARRRGGAGTVGFGRERWEAGRGGGGIAGANRTAEVGGGNVQEAHRPSATAGSRAGARRVLRAHAACGRSFGPVRSV